MQYKRNYKEEETKSFSPISFEDNEAAAFAVVLSAVLRPPKGDLVSTKKRLESFISSSQIVV